MRYFTKPTDAPSLKSNSRPFHHSSLWLWGMGVLALFFLYSCVQNVPGSTDLAPSGDAPATSDKKPDTMKKEMAEVESSEKPSEKEEDAADKGDLEATAAAEHKSLFIESQYPSATTCATCHPKHFEEWSKSQHAYAQLSPVYLSFSSFTNSTTDSCSILSPVAAIS